MRSTLSVYFSTVYFLSFLFFFSFFPFFLFSFSPFFKVLRGRGIRRHVCYCLYHILLSPLLHFAVRRFKYNMIFLSEEKAHVNFYTILFIAYLRVSAGNS